MLWIAPELLPDDHARRGTPEGDIYSFAIIMYEVHGRNGPFGDIELSPSGNYIRKLFVSLYFNYYSILNNLHVAFLIGI